MAYKWCSDTEETYFTNQTTNDDLHIDEGWTLFLWQKVKATQELQLVASVEFCKYFDRFLPKDLLPLHLY